MTAINSLRMKSPLAKITNCVNMLRHLDGRLRVATARAVENRRLALGAAVGQLESLSPLGVLKRGYSLCRLPSGPIVKSASDVGVGAAVEVLLHKGSLGCRVEKRTLEHTAPNPDSR
jgi:exodeoxyribonuclease VII large subunit